MTKYRVILRSTNEVYFETTSLIQLEGAEQSCINLNLDYFVES